MQMRQSKVLRKLRQGEVVNCMKINFTDARITELTAMCGFDCVWLDMEHVPNDWNAIEHQIRSTKYYGCDTMVRVERGSYSDYIKPFEADASGIMVPHVMSLQDAKDVVWKTRFYPIGRRACDGGNSDGAYCMMDLNEYVQMANEQRFVVIQIEDPEVLDDLEEIAQLDGIDIIFYGAGDFSHASGILGQWDHPLIQKTRQRIAKVARENGKYAGCIGSVENHKELVQMGYQFISFGADVVGLSNYYRDIMSRLGQLQEDTSAGIYGKTE
ncbi:MAG: aldolase [Planctomycetes bacterium]|nr:aldolase [Planctomycetota bacterium]